MKRYLITATSFWTLIVVAHGAEIPGTVSSATEEYVTVTTDSNLVPVPGDKAQIFFKLPGQDVEIAVATGHVYEITGSNIMVKIDKATGTVTKDQLVRITSTQPRKQLEATTSSPATKPADSEQVTPRTQPESTTPPPLRKPADPDQLAEETISFDALPPGPISGEAFADRGVHLRTGKGKPGIYRAEPSMVMSPSHQNVLLLAEERVTLITIAFDTPVKRFSLLRIGTTAGASLPTWTMKAYNGSGKVIGTAGETHGLPPAARSFAVQGAGIARVEISTDNRNGAGTWATWSSLPIAEFGFDR